MKPTTAARRKARRFALQALYQMELTGDSASVVEQQFLCDHDMKRVDTAYLHELLVGIAAQEDALLEVIKAKLDRDISEINPVEKPSSLSGALSCLKESTSHTRWLSMRRLNWRNCSVPVKASSM